MNSIGNIDSKFRFVILASKRAKQLLKGAKPKVKAKSRNPIRIAQNEVRQGVVEYEILPTPKEEFQETEDRIFVGEGVPDEGLEAEEVAGKEDLADVEAEVETDEETEDGEDEEEPGDDKDE